MKSIHNVDLNPQLKSKGINTLLGNAEKGAKVNIEVLSVTGVLSCV